MSNSGRKPPNKDPFASLGVDQMLGRQSVQPQPQQSLSQMKNESLKQKRLQSSAASPLSKITTSDLANVKLKRVTKASVPQSSGINLVRHQNHSGAQFADFMEKTRRDLTVLNSTTSGQDMFKSISDVHTQNPNLSMNIHDATKTGEPQKNKRQDYAQSQYQGSESDLIRFPGSGSTSDIHHHTEKTVWGTQGTGTNSAIALGHEMVHGSRGMLGQQQAAGIKEEKETTGKTNGSRTPTNHPTENSIRKDLTEQYYAGGSKVKSMPPRQYYSGHNVDQ